MARYDTRPRIYMAYVPKTAKTGRPRKHAYQYRIAYSVQMRGDDEDVPTLLIYGVPDALIKDACTDICRCMGDNIDDLVLTHEHSCRVRNGKCYWRVAIKVCGLNERFMDLDGLIMLIMRFVQGKANCKIRRYKLDTFLNL